jgi:hypothetical protein
MPAKSKKKTQSAVSPTPIPLVPTASFPMSGTPLTVPLPSAPSTTSSMVVLSTAVPTVSIPIPPLGYNPVLLVAYRGYHPRVAQVAAIPDAVNELRGSTAYTDNLGPAAPQASPFAQSLEDAVGWTNMRIQVETFLGYVKSQEAVAWKAGLTKIDQAKALYDVMLVGNAKLPDLIPAVSRLLTVTSEISQKGAVTRARKAKVADALKGAAAGAPAATPATGATSAPVVTSSTEPNGSGGAGH